MMSLATRENAPDSVDALVRAFHGPLRGFVSKRVASEDVDDVLQDIYLRRVENKDNKVIGIAAKALADSGAGCKLA